MDRKDSLFTDLPQDSGTCCGPCYTKAVDPYHWPAFNAGTPNHSIVTTADLSVLQDCSGTTSPKRTLISKFHLVTIWSPLPCINKRLAYAVLVEGRALQTWWEPMRCKLLLFLFVALYPLKAIDSTSPIYANFHNIAVYDSCGRSYITRTMMAFKSGETFL